MTAPNDPVVLAVDDDEKVLETYELWLDAEYDLRTADGGEAALEWVDESVDVVLLDRLMPGLSGDEVLERIRERGLNCRVAMVTAVEPDFDLAEIAVDAYVTKALDRATVRETVERLLTRTEYDDLVREHYAVAERLAAIEARKTEAELEDSEAYRDLSERFEALDERLSARSATLDRDQLVSTIDEPTDDGETR
jgi:DNA-binding response OmpR family regulator